MPNEDELSGEFQDLSQDTVKNEVPLIALEEDFFKISGQSYAVLSFIDKSQYAGIRLRCVVVPPPDQSTWRFFKC